MLFLNLMNDPIILIGFIIALLAAITVHEATHAWAANILGDPTAKIEGRLTLNPFAHLDLMGTIFLFLAGFGWGKPVPVNDGNLRHPKTDSLLISLAGPLSNLLLMIIILLIIRFFPMSENITLVLSLIAQINITLMIFNLIPIPPLDGAAILPLFLPDSVYESIKNLGLMLLIAFLIFSRSTSFLSTIIDSITQFFFNLFLK